MWAPAGVGRRGWVSRQVGLGGRVRALVCTLSDEFALEFLETSYIAEWLVEVCINGEIVVRTVAARSLRHFAGQAQTYCRNMGHLGQARLGPLGSLKTDHLC